MVASAVFADSRRHRLLAGRVASEERGDPLVKTRSATPGSFSCSPIRTQPPHPVVANMSLTQTAPAEGYMIGNRIDLVPMWVSVTGHFRLSRL
jgi:hypothetical protein